jgi:tight adherence protein B
MSLALPADPAPAVVAAAALSAASVWVVASSGSASSRWSLGRIAARSGRGRTPVVLGRVGLPVLALVIGVGAVAVVVVASGSAALLMPCAAVAVAAWTAGRRRQDVVAQLGRLDACGALLDGLLAELRSGHLPRDALVRAVDGARSGAGWEPSVRSGPSQRQLVEDLLRPVGVAAELGGDVVAVLRRQALLPGAAVLGWLAACWAVSERRGSGLGDAAVRIARAGQLDREQRAEVRSELSAARATARLLAVLPLVGIGLGHAMGADVLGVLLGGPLGAALITASVALIATGVAWVDALGVRATGADRDA